MCSQNSPLKSKKRISRVDAVRIARGAAASISTLAELASMRNHTNHYISSHGVETINGRVHVESDTFQFHCGCSQCEHECNIDCVCNCHDLPF